MKMRRLRLENFMAFEDFDVEWSPNVNVIFGENGTGKSSLLKVAYAAASSLVRRPDSRAKTKEELATAFAEKVCGVFRPEDRAVGRLATRKRGGSRAEIRLEATETDENGGFGAELGAFGVRFTSKQENRVSIVEKLKATPEDFDAVFLPPKEMISSTKNFQQLYERYFIPFDETYSDLTKQLDRPQKRDVGAAQGVMEALEGVLQGEVYQRNRQFYLKTKDVGELEMGLVAEGLRKVGTLWYLISVGCLEQNSILFWDEMEANLNPAYIKTLVDAALELARLGVQIFITTHSYFVQQYFNLYAAYRKFNRFNVDIRFFSFYLEESKNGRKTPKCETTATASESKRNAISEEFESVLDCECEAIDNEN